MNLREFHGVLPPMLTPLKEDLSVDREGVANLVNHLITGGSDGIFPAGTTGEGPNLTMAQWEGIVGSVVDEVRGRVPVFAGCIDISVGRVIEKVRRASEIGADAVVVTPPCYYRFTEWGDIALHFQSVLEVSSLPVVLYNIPQYTGNPVSLECVELLIENEKVVGVKDSSGDWTHFQALLELCTERGVACLEGAEPQSSSAVLLGASGIVPGFANFSPQIAKELYLRASEGKIKESFCLQGKANELARIWRVTRFAYVAGKVAVNLLGLCQPYTTVPLKATAEEKEAVRRILEDMGLVS